MPAARNLVFDGDYWYQYDAWNRLVQVNAAWRDTQEPFDVVVGDLVKHHSYDGLGRLVRTQSPVLGPTALRTERFHYDGVRRIQEIVTDPVASPGGAMSSGDPELEQLALATVEPGTDEQAAPLAFEQGQVEMMSGGGGPGGGGPGGGGIQPPRIDREYIWGPGDNGLDELLVQYDRYGDEWWAIMDAGGDLVALCDLLGEGEYDDVARVVAQWTYDAYGAVLTAEHLDGYTLDAAPHLGHKGLFLDRLDANVTQPRLVPFAHALYHARNRVYDVRHARWNQSDPNATALALLGAASFGRQMLSVVDSLDIEAMYGNGGSLYGYLGANPWMRSDAMGLSWIEDYVGVLLPIISIADSLMPVSFLGPLDEIYRGYWLMASIHAFIQGAAFDQEEHFDWALDWSASDDDNPYFGSRGGYDPWGSAYDDYDGGSEPAMAEFGRRPHPNQVSFGRRAEELSQQANGTVRAKRYTNYTDSRGRVHRRKLDNWDESTNVYMEVKAGRQTLTHRVKRQALIDMRLKRTQGTGVDDVKWEFWVRDLSRKDKEVSPELQNFLRDCGIEFSFKQLPPR